MKNSVKKLNILTLMLIAVFIVNIAVTLFAPSVENVNAGNIWEEEIFEEEEVEIIPPSDNNEDELGEEITQEKLIQKVFETLNGAMSYKSSTTGAVQTNVKVVGNITQNISSSVQRDSNGKVMLFNASVKSAAIGVTVGRQIFTDNGMAFYRDAKSVSANFEATYDDKWNRTTIDDYRTQFGITAGQSYYIVDESTILSYNDFKVTTTGYKCVIELDVTNAVGDYIRNVQAMSGSTTTPAFEYVKLTITADKDCRPTRIVIEEKYTVTVMGFKASCTTMTATKYNNWGKYFVLSTPKGIY